MCLLLEELPQPANGAAVLRLQPQRLAQRPLRRRRRDGGGAAGVLCGGRRGAGGLAMRGREVHAEIHAPKKQDRARRVSARDRTAVCVLSATILMHLSTAATDSWLCDEVNDGAARFHAQIARFSPCVS